MSAFDLDRFAPPLAVPHLDTPPLVLRPFEPGDLELVRQASLDPLITAISSVPATADDAASRDFIGRQLALADDGHAYPFVIALENGDGTGIGSIGLWLNEIDQGRASVGYWLLESARGHGLAARALDVVVRFAFTELAIPRLHLFVEPSNVASARTIQKAGFRHEATFRGWIRVEGAQRDADCHALLKSEWSGT